jgi:flavin-dependent dehydrogenase
LKKFDPGARTLVRYAAHLRGASAGELSEPHLADRDLSPGYAWAFPAPGGLINLGIGVAIRRLREDAVNLRQG